jgi:hypothetical protein
VHARTHPTLGWVEAFGGDTFDVVVDVHDSQESFGAHGVLSSSTLRIRLLLPTTELSPPLGDFNL